MNQIGNKMRSIKIMGNMDSKRKLLMSLFWTNKKAATTGSCEPFLIETIITEKNIYNSNENNSLKLSENILADILVNIDNEKEVKFKIKFGKEIINIIIYKNIFSVSTNKKELEYEITEKLEFEGKKMYPNVCSKFPQRIGIK